MRARTLLVGALCIGSVLVPWSPASAFSINSGFTAGCHERITLDAYERILGLLPTDGVVVPDDELWREMAVFLSDALGSPDSLQPGKVSDADLFLLTSLLIGIRAPDTDGHSVVNLSALRELHSDPSPEGQYAHALRGIEDNDQAGNQSALAGTRSQIRSIVELALQFVQVNNDSQIIMGSMYLDFYGRFDVPVHATSFHLGRAMHALQDSFAHAIRDEATGYREIVHIMNYVEAISGELEEGRDGLAHSDSMDDCTGEPGEPGGTVDAAIDASVDLMVALRTLATGEDRDALERFMDKWLTLRDGCTLENEFCGNGRWVAVARESQTEPYLEAIFGCSAGRRSAPGWGVLVLFSVVVLVSRRRLSRFGEEQR